MQAHRTTPPHPTRLLPVTLLLMAAALTACVAEEEPLHDDCDHEHGAFGSVEQGAAHTGPWSIPSSTLSAGDSMYVQYTGAGPWQGESSCTGGLTSGANALRTWIDQNYPQVSSIGGYSCRPINGNASQTSVHATGRALDVHIPLTGGEADNDLGDPIGNYLIEHAEEIGIQYIIWDRWSWNASRSAGDKSRSYGGAHPHNDHLHIELSVAASNMQTPFFQGGMAPPDDNGGTEDNGDNGGTGGDFCEEQGWYGDGFCDSGCPMPDPDCGGDNGGTGDNGDDGGTGDDNTGGDGGLDLCQILGWYGDGECDILCPMPDPDCTGDNGDNGDNGEGGDICEEQGWYGDGLCDPDCPMPDPDCQGQDNGQGGEDGNNGNTGEGGDFCQQQGWYGDGTCDPDCPMPDPDCEGLNNGDGEEPPVRDDTIFPDDPVGPEGFDDEGTKDICERRGLYGDGVCDRSCPRFDSDCRDAAADATGGDPFAPESGNSAEPLTGKCSTTSTGSTASAWPLLGLLAALALLARRRR